MMHIVGTILGFFCVTERGVLIFLTNLISKSRCANDVHTFCVIAIYNDVLYNYCKV